MVFFFYLWQFRTWKDEVQELSQEPWSCNSVLFTSLGSHLEYALHVLFDMLVVEGIFDQGSIPEPGVFLLWEDRHFVRKTQFDDNNGAKFPLVPGLIFLISFEHFIDGPSFDEGPLDL